MKMALVLVREREWSREWDGGIEQGSWLGETEGWRTRDGERARERERSRREDGDRSDGDRSDDEEERRLSIRTMKRKAKSI